MFRARSLAPSLRPRFGRALVCGLAILALLNARPARADQTFVVTSTTDNGTGSTTGTLSWAITQANNATSGLQTIDLSQLPANSTIVLSGNLPIINNANVTIDIEGPTSQTLTINGGNSHRIFFVAAGNVTIGNLALFNGAATGGHGGSGSGGGGGALGAGGALFVNTSANVTVQNLAFDHNSATGGTAGATVPTSKGGGGGGGFAAGGGSAINAGGGGGGLYGAGAVGTSGSVGGGGGGGGILGTGGVGTNGVNVGGGGGGGGGLTGGSAASHNSGGAGSGGATGGAGVASGAGNNGGSTTIGGGGGGGAPLAAGSGGAGGVGGFDGGGGGGGAGTNGNGGAGAQGGTFGGGGGGGTAGTGAGGTGGTGGDFGGGGGGGAGSTHGTTGGGQGGFGGGGGGANNLTGVIGGTGGFGAGNGGAASKPGSGGDGYGGAIFVRQGGTLTVVGSNTANSAVTAGASGGNGGAAGLAAGQDLYLMSGVNAVFNNAGSSMTGSISGAGGVLVKGQGTTSFTGTNNYTGGTTVQDTARLQGTTDSLQNAITDNANVTFSQSTDGTYGGVISGSGSVTLSGNGNVTFSGANNYSNGTTVSSGTLTGTTTSLQGGITNDANVTFDQATSGTYAGAMTGSGSVTIAGTGNVTFLGANDYSGGTTVSSGTLTGTTTSLQGAITNDSVVTISQNTGGTYAGNMTGSGQLVIGGTGAVTISGTNDYSGGTWVQGGTLIGTTSSLQGSIHNDSTVLFDQATDGEYAGTMFGSGGVTKTGIGSVSFTGANSYTDLTDIQQGRLAINGSITSDTVVESGATLGGNGIINGSVTNNGTLGPGNSIGTLTINGNYSDSAGSTMQVQINPAGSTPGVNNDLTVVNGTATLSGGTVDVAASPGTYTAGTRYTFLEATTLSGTYASITGLSNLNFHAVLGYGDIMVGSTEYMTAYFTLVSNQSDFASFATTFNQYGVANYIDINSVNPTAGMQNVINSLNTLTVPQQQAALDSMTAQVNGTIAQLNVQDTTFLYMMLRRRVGSSFAAGGATGGGFASAGGSAQGSSGKGGSPTSVSLVSNRSAEDWVMPCASGASNPTWGGWTSGYGLGGNAGSDGNAAGGVYGSGGTIAAIERPLDGNNLIGFFGAYSNLSVRLTGLPQSSSANQGSFGTYYLRDMGRTYFLAAGSVGFAGYRELRTMAFGNIDSTATGNYSGWNPSAYLEEGMRWQMGRTIVQPYGALQYIYVRQNSFTESGAGTLDQSVGGINTNALRGILGSRLAQVWPTSSGTAFVPELRAAWMHEFLDPSSTLNAVFAPIGGGSFAAQGLNFGRDWALLGGGTQYVMNQSVSLFANYDVQFNVRQAWNAGSGGVQFAW